MKKEWRLTFTLVQFLVWTVLAWIAALHFASRHKDVEMMLSFLLAILASINYEVSMLREAARKN